MRTQEQQENLEAARLLAEFLNLEPSQFGKFREEHWDFMLVGGQSWESMQRQIRKVWENGFRQKEVLQILSANDLTGSTLNPPTITTKYKDEQGRLYTEKQTLAEYQAGLGYKKAVLFLFTDSWRAKTCEWELCGKRFIAEHSQARFCSFGTGEETTCSWAHRKKYQKEKWEEDRERINKQRREEYGRLKKTDSEGHPCKTAKSTSKVNAGISAIRNPPSPVGKKRGATNT